ncbi:hypothetical protein CHLRE_03g181800v5 [Chlamydomonas reinhardtii]|uniref:Uncharacterized protein n=1 Tax=Chlamydomonas reinhardtii TaxID=3055 RepID=A0A2K3DXT3_CHLRE|nr:uncharacterized protein CHLRE_03g181800v5 [Chlamydomonas reinhardtii]PNW85341.1 hypothetical protein CHLRE_03g181800v5 [Chlamydomonas reinhardtii]
MLTRVDPSSFQDQDIVVNPAAIFASVVLLLLLLAFTFNRILGLDQILIKAARTATARREQEEREAMRKRLVQMLDGGADSGAGGANGVPKPPPLGNGPSSTD